MKSPRQLADQLVRQWQRGSWREQHLLHKPDVWPLRLSIGEPGADSFRNDSAALRLHLQQWRGIAQAGPGQVQWTPRTYRGGAAPVEVPSHWVLRPSDCAQAFDQCAGPAGAQASADYHALRVTLGQVDAGFHGLLVRRMNLWRGMAMDDAITAAKVAMQLAPGCAQGRPLRALAVAGNDSKLFERCASLVTALLDERFEGEASRQGLTAFLGAAQEGEHWLLLVPLQKGLLPFARQRVTVTELQATALAASRILVVENERCLHQLPEHLPDTIAILGAGLNLGWLGAAWLQSRHVAYWGDIDTWGLAMLATARSHIAHVQALLMDRTCFEAHQSLAVREPVHADGTRHGALAPDEVALDRHLRTLPRGRLEQEFLPTDTVRGALQAWRWR